MPREHRQQKPSKEVLDAAKIYLSADIYLFAACLDEQQSAAVSNVQQLGLSFVPTGTEGGACTSLFLQKVYGHFKLARAQQSNKNSSDEENNIDPNMDANVPEITYAEILEHMYEVCRRNNYAQVPMLSVSRPFDIYNSTFDILPKTFTGTRRALLIGVNYPGTPYELTSCHYDCSNMAEFLKRAYGFWDKHITTLKDDGVHTPPTRKNILAAFAEFSKSCRPGDAAFFHFSGHGGLVEDEDGDETAGFDQALLPCDYLLEGEIIDDDIFRFLLLPLPKGCTLTAVVDCCHSGTIFDLPFEYKHNGKTETFDCDVENVRFPHMDLSEEYKKKIAKRLPQKFRSKRNQRNSMLVIPKHSVQSFDSEDLEASAISSKDELSKSSNDDQPYSSGRGNKSCCLLLFLFFTILAATGILVYFFVFRDGPSQDSSSNDVAPSPAPEPTNCMTISTVDDLEAAILESKGSKILICGGVITFDREITFEAPPGEKIKLDIECSTNCEFDGGDTSRMFRFGAADFPVRKPVDVDIRFSNVVFKNGNGGEGFTRSDGGGAIQITATTEAKARFDNCVFEENRASFSRGGAIYFESLHTSPNLTSRPSLELSNCDFIRNTAEVGGAVSASDIDISIEASSFEYNVGFEDSGAIMLEQKYPENVATRCLGDQNSFVGNLASNIIGPSDNCDRWSDVPPTAPPGDACIQLINNTVDELDELINSPPLKGNNIRLCNTAFIFDREVTIFPGSDGRVSLSITCEGGCVFLGNGRTKFFRTPADPLLLDVSFENIIFQNGRAPEGENGGAIELIGTEDSVATFKDCTFRSNVAEESQGGAIFMKTIASSNDGEESLIPASLTLSNCNFLSNRASDGGAVAAIDVSISIEDSSFTGNRALGTFGGGAIYSGADFFPVNDLNVTCMGDANSFMDNIEQDIVGESLDCDVRRR